MRSSSSSAPAGLGCGHPVGAHASAPSASPHALLGLAARPGQGRLGLGHAVAQSDQRSAGGQPVVVGGHGRRTARGHRGHRADAVAQLDHHARGQLLADAGDRSEERVVARGDGPPHARRRVGREDAERHLRPHPADRDERQEQLALVLGREPVQREGVLAHDEVGDEGDVVRGGIGHGPRGGGGVDAQPDASDLDHQPVGIGSHHAAAQRRDHPAALPCPRSAELRERPVVAQSHGEGVGRVIGGGRFAQAEDGLDHAAHLTLLGPSVAAHRALDLRRAVLGARHPRRPAGGQDRAPCLAHGEDGAGIGPHEEGLQGHLDRLVAGDQGLDGGMDGGQAIADVVFGARLDAAVIERAHDRAVGPDDADSRCAPCPDRCPGRSSLAGYGAARMAPARLTGPVGSPRMPP